MINYIDKLRRKSNDKVNRYRRLLAKIQHPFMIKILRNKPGTEETFFNLIKGIYKKPIAHITLNGER